MKKGVIFLVLVLLGYCAVTGIVTDELIYEKEGWKILCIEGQPYERGFQHGQTLAEEIYEHEMEFINTFIGGENIEKTRAMFRELAMSYWDKVPEEYQLEMQGIADGAREQGFDISYKDILAMNGFMDIFYAQSYNSLKEQTEVRGCSAFIATGDYTKDGKIVIAHNSWTLYSQAKHLYYVVYVKPENGYAFTMQTAPGFIWSSTDWYINEKGLAVCETTLGFDGSGVAPYDEDGTPVFVRARNAVQYSSTIDEFVEMLVDNNNGAYANDWLIGDTKNNEIAILELGLNEHCLKRTTNGFFPSSNYIWCNEVRSEWFNAPAYNPPSSLRCMRLTQLCQIYRGRIDTEVAKKIISDHYDIAESKENIEGGRHLICGHMDLNETHLPAGSIDGKVADSAMIENMSFYAIAGHPCGIDFIAEEFKGLKDMIAHEWTYIDRTDINFY